MIEFADGYEGVEVAGLAVVRKDGETSVLLARRADDPSDDEGARQKWEFPGGHLMDGEEPFDAAKREFEEEIGFPLPDVEVIDGWRVNDTYQGFVVEALDFPATHEWRPTDEVQDLGWFTQTEVESLTAAGVVRAEIVEGFDWALVFGTVSRNQEDEPESSDSMYDEDFADLIEIPDGIPVHGVLAPEDTESGDQRGFSGGAMTTRPLPIPFRWQKSDIGGHDGAEVIGAVTRLMRKDGQIHWEGALMPTPEANDFMDMLSFFGRFGVSVDGDKGALDKERSNGSGITWFEAVRSAGLTAVAIPAFAEAYVALGEHPDMPDESSEDGEVLVAGAKMEFKRGAGWVTNPKETSRIHAYWTKKGEPGYAKIAWGTPGDFRRARALIGEKIAKNSPSKMRYLNQIIAQWHHDALGYWPGELDKPGNKTSAQAKAEREAKAAAEARDDFELDAEGEGWEAVLVSSATKARAIPPSHYFDRHPDTDALVIEAADENGLRRTYGYAGEWGVCHIAYDGQCVEVPSGDDFSSFHLGRTKTDEGYLTTGLITYKVNHRDAETILSESAEQQHFDNIANAWAAVRLGVDDRGVWFSGVVLPNIPEDDIVLIEASGQVSGEWKYGALRALQCVNVPGFPVVRSSAVLNDDGDVLALVASAHGLGECEPTPAERMKAIASIEAEVRMESLREKWVG